MNFYEITLRAMHKLLTDCGEQEYAACIADCLEQWTSNADMAPLLQAFSKKGKFAHFAFEHTVFPTEERNYWTQQLFGGLTAMAMQLAKFAGEGKSVDIRFIRQHFGYPAEMITGSMCADCQSRQISMADIDRYISMQVISAAIVDGLEAGDLTKATEEIMQVKWKDIKALRDKAQLRALNTNVDVSSGRMPMTVCMKCGGKNIRPCRFLKSVKELVFVPLSH